MWPTKVIARLEGGLGNQLFQYAAARSLADRLGCDLSLDLRDLQGVVQHPFQLGRYGIRASTATSDEMEHLPDWKNSRLGRIRSQLSQQLPFAFSFPVFWPQSFAFDPRFDRISKPVFLVGYWQTEKYFAWNRAHILRDIQLISPLRADTPMLDHIRSTNSVSLHIRRGDYISNPDAAKFHGLCDLTYYHAAVADMSARRGDISVFVFSDEPAWARENLKLEVPTYYVEGDACGDAHTDLELMSLCKHHIIANSSFSWWGAWRSATKEHSVIAPVRWFLDAGTDTRDVVPYSWIRR